MLHLNARSLNRNLDSIKLLLQSLEHTCSFIGICESWLRPNTNSPSMFDIEGYTLLRADRCDGRGGGVALYFENGISFKLLDNMPEISHCETLSIEVNNGSKHKSTAIGVIYHPPGTPVDQFSLKTDQYIHTMSENQRQVYLMGDFNINLLLNENEISDNNFITLL